MKAWRIVFALLLLCLMQGARAEDTQVYEISIRRGVITPAALNVKAGSRIKLSIKNEGPGPSEFENLELRVEKVLAPGTASFVVMRVPQSGSYRFVDEFHPEAPGMMLNVK